VKFIDSLILDPRVCGKLGDFGWGGVVVAGKFDKNFKDFSKKVGADCLSAALIEKDITKSARRALDAGADLVYVAGGSDEVNRQAVECWEVDVLLHPEKGAEKDFMDAKNSGLDAVMAKMMAEKGIMLGIVLADILEVSGGKRVQTLGRIRQNLMLSKKYGIKVVYCSGAKNEYDLRGPKDVSALFGLLGCENPLNAVSKNPGLLFQKALDRNDPNILTKGLRVVSWGDDKPPEKKKKYGWL